MRFKIDPKSTKIRSWKLKFDFGGQKLAKMSILEAKKTILEAKKAVLEAKNDRKKTKQKPGIGREELQSFLEEIYQGGGK